jgi:hypothetical protein
VGRAAALDRRATATKSHSDPKQGVGPVAAPPVYFNALEHSLRAAMVFPGEPAKARAYAAWLLIREADAATRNGLAPVADLLAKRKGFVELAFAAAEFAYIHEDMQKNIADGQRAGTVIACLWSLICEGRRDASVEMAVQAAERYLNRYNLKNQTKLASGDRTLQTCVRKFKPVLHLLAARTLRRNRPSSNLLDLEWVPSVGYTRKHDLLFFAQEAKAVREGLLAWDQERSERSEYLGEMFEIDDRWAAPPRQAGWPDTGTPRRALIEPDVKPVRKRPGRPKTP